MALDLAKALGKASQQRAVTQSVAALARRGLALTPDEARELCALRSECLAELERVEWGPGILPDLVEEFADSPCLQQEDLAVQLADLQEAFYQVRDYCSTEVPDAEILAALHAAFEGAAGGDAAALAQMDPRSVMASEKKGSCDACCVQDEPPLGDDGVYRIADAEGRVYVYDPEAWRDDVLAPGWEGEGWEDDEVVSAYER